MEEIRNLACNSVDWDLRGSRIFQNGINLVKVGTLESYVIPILLEGLLGELINVLDDFVRINRQFDF